MRGKRDPETCRIKPERSPDGGRGQRAALRGAPRGAKQKRGQRKAALRQRCLISRYRRTAVCDIFGSRLSDPSKAATLRADAGRRVALAAADAAACVDDPAAEAVATAAPAAWVGEPAAAEVATAATRVVGPAAAATAGVAAWVGEPAAAEVAAAGVRVVGPAAAEVATAGVATRVAGPAADVAGAPSRVVGPAAAAVATAGPVAWLVGPAAAAAVAAESTFPLAGGGAIPVSLLVCDEEATRAASPGCGAVASDRDGCTVEPS